MRIGRVCCIGVAAIGLACKPYIWTPFPPKPAPAQKPYNLRWDPAKLDPNGAPVNPRWASQTPGNPASCSAKPYTSACTDHPVLEDKALATLPFCGPFSAASGNFPGHKDWTIAQYTGAIGWLNFGADFDFDFMLIPQGEAGITRDNHFAAGVEVRPDQPGQTRFIELEFDSREVAREWKTPWWTDLRSKVELGGLDTLSAHLNSQDPGVMPCGVVLGVFGLDCEHGCPSEVHPVYAMAIQVDASARRNTWAVFARNWGNGGFCSRYDHQLFTQGGKLWLLLPRATSTPPRKTTFEMPEGAAEPRSQFWPGQGLALQFQLPPPEKHGAADLVVEIEWADETGAFSCPVARYTDRNLIRTIEDPEKPDTTERYLEYLERKGARTEPRADRPPPPPPPPPKEAPPANVKANKREIPVPVAPAPTPAVIKPPSRRLSTWGAESSEAEELLRRACAAYEPGKAPEDRIKDLNQSCAKLRREQSGTGRRP